MLTNRTFDRTSLHLSATLLLAGQNPVWMTWLLVVALRRRDSE